jgi:hypothetical protein
MKNVTRIARTPVAYLRAEGAPPFRGWVIRYLSGAEEYPDWKSGDWMTYFDPDTNAFFFSSSEPKFRFETTEYAAAVVRRLQEATGIKAEAIWIERDL